MCASDCQCDVCKECPFGGYGYMGSDNYYGSKCSVGGKSVRPNSRTQRKVMSPPAGFKRTILREERDK